jgi:hypothetical protein
MPFYLVALFSYPFPFRYNPRAFIETLPVASLIVVLIGRVSSRSPWFLYLFFSVLKFQFALTTSVKRKGKIFIPAARRHFRGI